MLKEPELGNTSITLEEIKNRFESRSRVIREGMMATFVDVLENVWFKKSLKDRERLAKKMNWASDWKTHFEGWDRENLLEDSGLTGIDIDDDILSSLSEEEKRFVLLCNKVLGLGLIEEEFLRMSEEDKKELNNRIIGV